MYNQSSRTECVTSGRGACMVCCIPWICQRVEDTWGPTACGTICTKPVTFMQLLGDKENRDLTIHRRAEALYEITFSA